MSILPIFIPHAGCPHQCVFCNQKKISGQHSAALESAKEQIARWRSWLRPSLAHEAAFYGGSFTGLPLELQEELLALMRDLQKKKAVQSLYQILLQPFIAQQSVKAHSTTSAVNIG